MPTNTTQQPAYEGFLARHFPGWHARREEARTRSQALSTYRGAINSRLSTGWGGERSYTGGRSADRRDYGSMRERGRRVYANNAIGRSLLNCETDNIVSDIFNLQARTDSPEFNDEAESRWGAWLDRADLYGKFTGSDLMRTSWRQPRMDGDGGFVLVSTGGASRLQYVPGDWIESPMGRGFMGRQQDGSYLFDGVETDAAGSPTAFWVKDENELGKLTHTRVLASDFIFLGHLNGPLEVRGMTAYAPVFERLDQLDGFVDAVTIAARMAAMWGLVWKSKTGAKGMMNLPLMTDSQGNAQRAVTMENGQIKVLGTDDEVVQVQAQQPMSTGPEWVRTCFRLICAAFDMPLEIGLRDLSQVNFSGGRIGLIGYYRSCRTKQEWLMTKCWDRVYRWWLDREVKLERFTSKVPAGTGTDGRPAFEKHQFVAREWAYTDPVSEAQADLLEISMGIKSPDQACMERGRDPYDTRRQLAAAREANQAAGIPNVLSSLTRDEAPEPAAPAPALTGAEDATAFKRTVVSAFLADRTVNDVIYNVTDITTLLTDVGLPLDRKVLTNPDQAIPYLPVIAEPGPLVSGETIQDPQGDIVGGDVENTAPADTTNDQQNSTQSPAPVEGQPANGAIPNE